MKLTKEHLTTALNKLFEGLKLSDEQKANLNLDEFAETFIKEHALDSEDKSQDDVKDLLDTLINQAIEVTKKSGEQNADQDLLKRIEALEKANKDLEAETKQSSEQLKSERDKQRKAEIEKTYNTMINRGKYSIAEAKKKKEMLESIKDESQLSMAIELILDRPDNASVAKNNSLPASDESGTGNTAPAPIPGVSKNISDRVHEQLAAK